MLLWKCMYLCRHGKHAYNVHIENNSQLIGTQGDGYTLSVTDIILGIYINLVLEIREFYESVF